MKSREIAVSKPKSARLPVFLKVTEHVAVYFPWPTNELNRVDEYKMVHSLNQAVLELKSRKLSNLGFVQVLVMFWNRSHMLHCVKKIRLSLQLQAMSATQWKVIVFKS